MPGVTAPGRAREAQLHDLRLQGQAGTRDGRVDRIGEALAVAFAERGATVGICARRADRLAAVLEKLQAHSPQSRSWTVDLADLDAVDNLATDVVKEFGGLDVLVNNAGIRNAAACSRSTPPRSRP